MTEETIFAEAIEKKTPEERAMYLDRACGHDAHLRARVEGLLKAHDHPDSFLDDPVSGAVDTIDHAPVTERPGTIIGRYKLLQEIGEGGFGIVYMAEQQVPVRRKVALKIIKPGMDTRQVIARFEAERQALALMDHPNIAKVLDAGSTESGRSYFVMELVKGIPITEFCDQNELPTEDRLGLFTQVCRAVQHAHQKGIIHRDIKPSNILVTLHDGKPVPKVIDFGVSKAISQQLTEKTLFTAYGQMVGTPQYMSPEQAEMSGLDIDTRSDIYSLGVLLYELLTGTTPLEADKIRAAGYREMQKMIREEEPPRPSLRLSTLGDRLTAIAKHRSSDPARLRQLIRGELDWIVLRCLEKDRSRRYESPASLAGDVERFLAGETVDAHPPSTTYRLRKLLQRNRRLVMAAATVMVALVFGIVGTTLGMLQAFKHAQDANRNAVAEKAARLETQQAQRKAERERQNAEAALTRERRTRTSLSMIAAFQAYEAGNIDRAEGTLREVRNLEGMNEPPNFAWRFLAERCRESKFSKVLRSFDTESEPVVLGSSTEGCHIAYAPNGELLAAGLSSGEVFLHDLRTGNRHALDFPDCLRHNTRSVHSVAFSPNGKQLVAAGGVDQAGFVCLWELSSRQPSLIPIHEDSPIRRIKFHPSGNLAATITTDGRNAGVWTFPEGLLKWTKPIPSGVFADIAFLPDAKSTTVAGSTQGGSFLWNVDADRVLSGDWKLGGYTLSFSPDGKLLVTASNGGVFIWDMLKGIPQNQRRLTWRRCDGLAFSPDGQLLATRDRESSTVWIWRIKENHLLGKFFGAGPSVEFSPCGKWLATGQIDVLLWDLTPYTRQVTRMAHDSMRHIPTAMPDGKTIAVRSDDGIKLWDTESGRTCELQGAVPPLAVSRTGSKFASGGVEKTILLWNTTDQQYVTVGSYEGNLCSVDISPDERWLASSATVGTYGAAEGDVRLWDLRTNQFRQLKGHDNGRVLLVRFSPSGRYLASSAGAWGGRSGHTDCTRLWDISDPAVPCVGKLEDPAAVLELAFSPDEKLLALTGRNRNEVVLWKVPDGTRVSSFQVTGPWVSSLVFSLDGKTLVGASPSGQIKFWRVPTGEELGTLNREEGVGRVTFFPGHDHTLITAGYDAFVRLWSVPPM